MSAATADVRTRFLTTADDVRIAVHACGADGAPRVLLVPGTFSNSSFWFGTRGTGFGRFLADSGYEAWSLDPRGHGASARPPRGVRWDFDDWARHDVASAIGAAASGGNPVVVVGHSAGGAAALAALAAEPRLRGKVRSAIILATPGPWILRWRALAARAALLGARLLPRFPARLLRLGPEDELPGVIEQWMRWNLGGHWRGDDGTDYTAALTGLELPMLFVAGTGDRLWAPPAACRELYEQVGSRDKTFLLCGTHAGFSEDFDHVSLVVGRAARREVWPLVRNWLGRLPLAGA
ncbi:MAG TPA: alpha/beta fold hydrolase [Longimicrobiales bacterium]|nr:alpha/beta fold hydrolase [Longimicrobiales bacterium]